MKNKENKRPSQPFRAGADHRGETGFYMQEKNLVDFHVKIQKIILAFVGPASILVFGALVALDPCWQNIVTVAAFLVTYAFWWVGHGFSRKGNLQGSVATVLSSAIVFVTLNAMLVKGVAPTQLLACSVAVIYAAFYSKRFLQICVVGAFIGFVLAESAVYLDLYPMKELAPLERLITEASFAALLLTAAAMFLRNYWNMNDRLVRSETKVNTRLSEIIDTASDIEGTLGGVVTKIEKASTSFASKASEQAVALKEMSVSIDHIRNSAKDAAEAAADTKGITDDFQNKSAMGSDRLKEMVNGFDRVVEINESVKVEFSTLAAQADSIEEVLRTNREIAAQIKILATNAGIQASKVGKQGRGFRVVANELKAMIQRTDDSLKQSRQLLEDIRSQADKSREAIEKSSNLVKNQFDQLSSTGALVENIATTCVDAAAKVEKIANAARAQQIRLDEVASGINHIDFTADEMSKSTGVLVESIRELAKSNETIKDALDLR